MATVDFPPLAVKTTYSPDGAMKGNFLAAIDDLTSQAKRRFQGSFDDIDRIINKVLASPRSGLNFDIPGLRKIAADADLALQRVTAMRDAATRLAASTGDTSAETTKYMQALSAQVIEAERAKQAADAQVSSYNLLQREIDSTAASQEKLAAAYRATFLEQARSSNSTFAAQQAINSGYGLSRTGADTYGFAPSKSAAASAAVFQSQSYAPKADVRDDLQRLRDGAASLDRAAVSGTTLEQVLGRVATKSAAVGDALAEAGRAAERAAQEQADADAVAARAADAFAKEINAVRQAIDPTLAAQQRLDAELAQAERVFAAGKITAEEYGQAVNVAADGFQAQVQGARAGTTANNLMVNSTRSLRIATLQAGQQLQDIGVSLYSGQRAGVVFAQQLPQLAFALSYLEGSANKTQNTIGKFATVLSGPWGLAAGLAIGVIAELATSYLGADDAAQKSKASQESFADSLDRTKHSYGEVIQAIHDYNAAQERSRELTLENAQAAATAAAKNIQEALSIRKKLQGRYDEIQAAPSLSDPNAEAARQMYLGTLDSQIRANNKSLTDLSDEAQKAVGNVAEELAKLDTDPTVKIKVGFQKLRDDAHATIKDVSALRARLGEINKDEKAATEALKTNTSNRQYGREIDLAEAKTIAQSAGFQVNSARRPTWIRDETPGGGSSQERLYDKWVAEGRPAGNPTAAPGHSAHETGSALDIQASAGVSIASIRKAYADEGVKLTKILKEQGHFHIEWSTTGADKVEREAKKLQDFGNSAAASIAQINAQFDDQPKLVDQAAAATRKLDEIYAGLASRNLLTPQLKKQIDDARKEVSTVVDRQIAKQAAESQQQLQIQELIISGHEREAAVFQAVAQAHQKFGDNILPKELAEVQSIAAAEYDRSEAMKRQQEMAENYLDATRSVRQEIEGILAGEGKLSDFQTIFKRLNAQVITQQLFGSVFENIDRWVKQNTPLDAFMQSAGKAGDSVEHFGDVVLQVADRIANASVAGSSASPLGAGAALVGSASNDNGPSLASIQQQFDRVFGNAQGSNGEIVVTATKPISAKLDRNTVAGMSPDVFAQQLGKDLGGVISDQLSGALGPGLSSTVGSIVGGAFYGNAVGGVPGGILGALQGIKGLPEGLTKALGKGVQGAETGSLVAGLGNALGLHLSTTGAQLGGAVGSIVGPIGSIIGSIAGGLLGSLFHKTTQGYAVVTNTSVTSGGNNDQLKAQEQTTGEGIQGSLQSIADRLGATVGNYAVSIAQRSSGWIHVSASGSSKVGNSDFPNKAGSDSIYNGKDPEEATRVAIANAIQDGAIQGIHAGTQAILKAAKDIDKGVSDAVDFESIFTRLKAYTDPVGAALDTLDKEFSHLRDLAVQAGEGMTEVEQLYAKERAKVIEQANEQLLGNLKNLYSQLTIGDSGLSLRERQANAQAAYDPLAARVAAGDTSAYDDYAAAAQTLLDVTRQMYGSQDQYFSVFDQIKDLTKGTIDSQTAIADAAANRDSPFSNSASASNDNAAVVSAIDAQTQAIIAALNAQGFSLSAINDNLGTLISQSTANGSAAPTWAYNFASYF